MWANSIAFAGFDHCVRLGCNGVEDVEDASAAVENEGWMNLWDSTMLNEIPRIYDKT